MASAAIPSSSLRKTGLGSRSASCAQRSNYDCIIEFGIAGDVAAHIQRRPPMPYSTSNAASLAHSRRSGVMVIRKPALKS
jgi:hypothetical protein